MASAVAGLVTAASSCVRLDLDNLGTEGLEDTDSQALRISGEDAVVLCPLSAALDVDGEIAIVWAGYPPADDRLQLMHARVSTRGELLRAPHGIALLDQELNAVLASTGDVGLRVNAIEKKSREMIAIELDEQGQVLGAEALPVDFGTLADGCEVEISTADGIARIFRGQVDGELPLFVEISAD